MSVTPPLPIRPPVNSPATAQASQRLLGSILEVLCHTTNPEALDPRTRLYLQEALIRFIKDENKWSTLPLNEQSRLLQKLTVRFTETNPFSQKITIRSINDQGTIITRTAHLLLDTTRNKNLSVIFDQIISQDVAMTFYEQFAFGICEHLDRLVSLETQIIGVDKSSPESHLLPISYVDIQDQFLPLSVDDLTMIKSKNLGIMVPLIPRFLRLPLNKLYHAITKLTHDFPSLVFQFYLDTFFDGHDSRHPIHNEEIIRILFTKAFYTIVRLRGLTPEHLHMPEATRAERFDYFTLDDEQSSQLMAADTTALRQAGSLREELSRLRDRERQIKQRRQVFGPSVKVELSLDQILKDIFQILRDHVAQGCEDEVAYLQHTVWIPQRIEPIPSWEQEKCAAHFNLFTSEEYIACYGPEEQACIRYWLEYTTQECENEQTLSQIAALKTDISVETLAAEMHLRFAQRHYEILLQDQDIILTEVIAQITRMLRMGAITAEMVLRDRYDSFSQSVLPHFYFFRALTSTHGEVWLTSPYVLSKIIFSSHLIDHYLTIGHPEHNSIDLAIAKDLLHHLLLTEQNRSENLPEAG